MWPFIRKPNPYRGVFKGWNAKRNYITSPNNVFCLWIGNSYDFFDDWRALGARKTILHDLPKSEKKRLWEALQLDIEEAKLKAMEKLLSEGIEL